jgi:hypothetical protein
MGKIFPMKSEAERLALVRKKLKEQLAPKPEPRQDNEAPRKAYVKPQKDMELYRLAREITKEDRVKEACRQSYLASIDILFQYSKDVRRHHKEIVMFIELGRTSGGNKIPDGRTLMVAKTSMVEPREIKRCWVSFAYRSYMGKYACVLKDTLEKVEILVGMDEAKVLGDKMQRALDDARSALDLIADQYIKYLREAERYAITLGEFDEAGNKPSPPKEPSGIGGWNEQNGE